MNKNIKQYSQKEISNIESNKIKIAKSDDDIIKFVDETNNTKSSNKKIYFGIINNKLARKIYKETKVNTKNYNISLKIDSIKHILSHHSNKKRIFKRTNSYHT